MEATTLREKARDLRAEIILFVGFVLTCLWCANGLLGSNSITRVALSHSLVRHGSLNIDDVAGYTIDKAHWRGHYFCDKAPGISLLCAPAVAAAEFVADEVGAPRSFTPVRTLPAGLRYGLDAIACLFFSSILFAGFCVVAFRRTLIGAGTSVDTANVGAIVLAFGTPLFIWSTAIFGHATSTALLFIGFAVGWRHKPAQPLSLSTYSLVGALFSLALLVEFTAAPPAALICVLMLVRDPFPKSLRALVVRGAALLFGAIPFAMVLLVYNDAAFGAPLHLGYASVEGFSGMKQGLFGIGIPQFRSFWGITFGDARGIFWLSPVLLFAVPAVISLWRRSIERLTIATCVSIAIYYLLVNSGYYYWTGGYSLGPRHITPMVPFLLFPVALWADRVSRPVRIGVLLIAILSIFMTLLSTSIIFRLEDDGRALITGHLIPALTSHRSDLVLTALHVPFYALIAAPFALVLVTSFLLLGWDSPSALRTSNRIE